MLAEMYYNENKLGAEAVLKAVNLGDDADTTDCITGGLAGTCYGISSIPQEWIDTIAKRNEIVALADQLSDFK